MTKENKKKPAKKTASKVKKAIKTRSKKIANKTAKLPSYMTNKHALNHYRFALKYVELELNGIEAYLEVYGENYKRSNGKEMTRKVAATQANRLLINVEIQQYIKELVEEWMLEQRTNAKSILARYNRWADSNIADYMDWAVSEWEDEDGAPHVSVRPDVIPLSQLSVEQQKNIKSVSFSKDGFKFELVDKKGSNDQLAKLTGLDKAEKESGDIHLHFDSQDELL